NQVFYRMKKGLTIIEVIISVAIISICILIVAQIYARVLAFNKQAIDKKLSMNLIDNFHVVYLNSPDTILIGEEVILFFDKVLNSTDENTAFLILNYDLQFDGSIYHLVINYINNKEGHTVFSNVDLGEWK